MFGVMWSYLLVRDIMRAAQFCTRCKRCTTVCGRPYNTELQEEEWRVYDTDLYNGAPASRIPPSNELFNS